MSSARSMARCNGSPRRNAEMTLGRTSAGKIKIKTDTPKGLRAVECGCCGPCGGCPDLIGGLPGVGEPPIKPTSLAWEAILSIAPNIGCPSSDAALSGVIERVEGQVPPCSANVGFAKRCYFPCEEGTEGAFCYASTVTVSLLIGKYKTEIFTISDPCGSRTETLLVHDPEADCAYWIELNAHESFGADGYSSGAPGYTGPIIPENIIGSHSVTGSVCAGTVEYAFDEETQTTTYTYGPGSFIQRSASITFS